MSDRPRFTVVGAGLGGALMAVRLARAGHRVDVYEKRSDPRVATVESGRSINLALSTRGIAALEAAGAAGAVLRDAIPMRGRMIHTHGELRFQPYDKDPRNAILSVSRLGLNVTLMNEAEAREGVRLHFDRVCVDLDPDTGEILFEHTKTGERETVRDTVVIGADGAFSAVRGRLQRVDRFDFQQSYLHHGYKELTIPPAPDGGFRMEKNALHIWPRGHFMMIALPNPNASFTCTLFWPFEGENSFRALEEHPERIELFFRQTFNDAVPMMPDLVSEYCRNPTSSLVTIRCFPWHHRDRVVLLGDACHAIVPFYGQGMNAAFEDTIILSECLDRHGADLERAFRDYEDRRKDDVDTLADLAIANFIEMRDLTASKRFLLRKRIEKELHRFLPGWYRPLYSMVTFSRIPYREAVRLAKRQDRVVAGAGIAIGLVLVVLLLLLVSCSIPPGRET